MVHRSTWEPRPQNDAANHTAAPPGARLDGYAGMVNGPAVFGRVTGNFTGTTDEIIQWAAAKWGLPDEVIRGEAVVESSWYQGLHDESGAPLDHRGFGDFGDCGGSPPGAPYGPDGPSSFGLLQAKWCSLENQQTNGTGGWPWTERSTAYAVDTYAAVVRGCYEGWDVWLGGDYRAGDLWGCVGRWFAGDWHSSTGDGYAARVQQAVAGKPWLSWPIT
jgi:autotransporter family porin